jgi:malonate transporter and related proteins
VAIGLFIGAPGERYDLRPVGRLVLLKLLLQPAITWVLVFQVLDMPLVWAQSAVLLSSLPTGIGPFVIAKAYQREDATTTGTILVSTLLSVITVSALVTLYAVPG